MADAKPWFRYDDSIDVRLMLPEGKRWTLLHDWWFEWWGDHDDDPPIRLTAPAGLVTDFGSIPAIFHARISPTGAAAPAFLAHDTAYAALIDRAIADRIMLDGLKVCGISFLLRHAVHKAVRLFGRIPYARHQAARAAGLCRDGCACGCAADPAPSQ